MSNATRNVHVKRPGLDGYGSSRNPRKICYHSPTQFISLQCTSSPSLLALQ